MSTPEIDHAVEHGYIGYIRQLDAAKERNNRLTAHLENLVGDYSIRCREIDLSALANHRKRKQLRRLQDRKPCWWCRLKRWTRVNVMFWRKP